VATCILVYLQIVLGAVLRHVPVAAEPAAFALAVKFHLAMAGMLAVHVALLAWSVLRHVRHLRPLSLLACLLVGLLLVQGALGGGTWIVKFSTPEFLQPLLPASWHGRAIVDGGWLQTHVITAHVAVGSLLLATSLALALHASRRLTAPQTSPQLAIRRREAAV
jgi:cytochrome c oxidase assembly protein subunit 15